MIKKVVDFFYIDGLTIFYLVCGIAIGIYTLIRNNNE